MQIAKLICNITILNNSIDLTVRPNPMYDTQCSTRDYEQSDPKKVYLNLDNSYLIILIILPDFILLKRSPKSPSIWLAWRSFILDRSMSNFSCCFMISFRN